MNGWLVFIIIVLLILSGSYFGWYFYARWNASRNGLPPPSMNPMIALSRSNNSGGLTSNYPGPAPTGIKGWFDAQVSKFKNRNNRYTTGSGYEETGLGGNARGVGGGRGAGSRLDPDEAWSSRVGDEAYYEEQELGLHEPVGGSHNQSANPYAHTSYTPNEPSRGRSRQRESYDEHLDATNPFGDDNAASLRGVSPRPVLDADTSYRGPATATMPSAPRDKKNGSLDSADNSPTESRRSIFREGL